MTGTGRGGKHSESGAVRAGFGAFLTYHPGAAVRIGSALCSRVERPGGGRYPRQAAGQDFPAKRVVPRSLSSLDG